MKTKYVINGQRYLLILNVFIWNIECIINNDKWSTMIMMID